MPGNAVETWCNQVAAELLVPMAVFLAELVVDEPVGETLTRLARRFKVSTLVVLRRLSDAGRLDRDMFFRAYRAELEHLRHLHAASSGGGDFYRTTASRVSKRFARALVESTLEGRTLYRDAFRMLGIAKTSTFNEFGRSLNFPL
jgi:Zn-dependent peptidase ImmA (M78 family)